MDLLDDNYRIIYYFYTRQIPAGQGCANRRHCHFMRRQLEYVVDTSQFRHSLDGHFQAGDTIITIGTFLQRFSKKSIKTGSPNMPALKDCSLLISVVLHDFWRTKICFLKKYFRFALIFRTNCFFRNNKYFQKLVRKINANRIKNIF